jgi:hypothetical protein
MVSPAQVEFVPEYHVYEYGDVPPEAEALSCNDRPWSRVGVTGEGLPAPKGGFTVTRSPAENAVTGFNAESVAE